MNNDEEGPINHHQVLAENNAESPFEIEVDALRGQPLPPEEEPPNRNSVHEQHIRGVPVRFPCQPYEAQIKLIDNIFETFETNDQLFIHDSPGTGKTFAMLNAGLAWLEHLNGNGNQGDDLNEEENPSASNGRSHSKRPRTETDCCTCVRPNLQLIIAARTNFHVNEIIKEAQRMPYKVATAVLAGKSVMCLQPRPVELDQEMDQGSNDDNSIEDEESQEARIPPILEQTVTLQSHLRCQCVRRCFPDDHPPSAEVWSVDALCGFGKDLRNSRQNLPYTMDDIKARGSVRRFCPYHCSMHLVRSAQLIFCTYPHVLDKETRECSGLDLANSILIFEEAHNLTTKCMELLTKFIYASKLRLTLDCLIELQTNPTYLNVDIRHHIYNGALQVVIEVVQNFLEIFTDPDSLLRIAVLCDPEQDLTFAPFCTILHELDLNARQCDHYVRLLTPFKSSTSMVTADAMKAVVELSRMLRLLSFLQSLPEDQQRAFHIEIQVIERPRPQPDEILLQIICVDPTVLLRRLASQSKSVLMASGSLAPDTDDFIASEIFGSDTSYALDRIWRPAIGSKVTIRKSSLFVGFISKYWPTSVGMKFNGEGVQNEGLNQLGITLSALFTIVPNGIVVLFESYEALVTAILYWKSTGMLELLSLKKQLFTEFTLPIPYEQYEPYMEDFIGARLDSQVPLNDIVSQFKTAARSSTGAAFFQGLRGNLSEGLNWRGPECRAAVVIGVSHLPASSPPIVQKIAFNDRMRLRNSPNSNHVSGKKWVHIEALHHVNTALGRSVHRPDDYGLSFAIDERFQELFVNKRKRLVSSWAWHPWSSDRGFEWKSMEFKVIQFVQQHRGNAP